MPVLVLFATYLALDRITQRLSTVSPRHLDRVALLPGAIQSNPIEAIAALVAVGLLLVLRRGRIGIAWEDLEQGSALRRLTIPLVLLLVWQYAFYDINFLFGRTHGLDRSLVVLLGAMSIWRPLAVAPFVFQVRVVASQYEVPFGTLAAQNMDELLAIVLLAMAALHLVHVVLGPTDTSPVVLLIVAAVVAHFWIPGKAKFELGWLGSTDLSNLPRSAHTAGWQGHGDGGWGDRLSRMAGTVGGPMKVATLAIELGAPFVILAPRLLRLWLPVVATFHMVIFAFTGYWFLSWIVLEAGLLVLVTRPSLRSWVDRNAAVARRMLGVFAVLLGSILFHPPALAWLDSPVSYGLRVDVVGESGTRYAVPAAQFAPLEQEVTFLRLDLGGQPRAAGAYGAVSPSSALDELRDVVTYEQLELVEAGFATPELDPWAELFFERWLVRASRHERTPWHWIAPPDHFWTSRPEPTFDFDEGLSRLEVSLVTAIHDTGLHPRSELLLTLVLDSMEEVHRVYPEPEASDG